MDEARRRDERAAAAGDMDAKKRLFIGRLRAGEMDPNAAALAAILGREEALDVVGSKHETFLPDADVSPRRIFELQSGDRIGHSAAFHYLTMLEPRQCAMWALDTALRAIDTGQNGFKAGHMLLIQSLFDWIIDNSQENLFVVERSRDMLELDEHGGPGVDDVRARVLIQALSVPTNWNGPNADSAGAAVRAAIEAGDLALVAALANDESQAAAEAAQRREWKRQRVNLAKIALLEDQAHDEEGRPRAIPNPARNSDEGLRAIERQVAGAISRDEIDEDETSPELTRLLKAFARSTETLHQAGDRLLATIVNAMGLDTVAGATEAAYVELRRLDGLRPPAEESVLNAARETFRRLDKQLQDGMVKAVGITSATVAVLDREAGVEPPDLDAFHCVHRDVGVFDEHGPAYPWVRPREFEVIDMVDVSSAFDDAPAGCLKIEKGGYWPGHLREAARMSPPRGEAHVLAAAIESASRRGVVSSTWLLGQVRVAADVIGAYAGFSRDQTEGTLLIQRRSAAARADANDLASEYNCENVETCGRLTVGAWRYVTGENAVGAVLVIDRRDLVLRTVGRGAVLSNRVGDELYRWLDRQPEMREAVADLERQGLIRVTR